MSTVSHKKDLSGIVVVNNMRDYSKDPFVIKKLEQARAFIAKHGLPKISKSKKSK